MGWGGGGERRVEACMLQVGKTCRLVRPAKMLRALVIPRCCTTKKYL